MNHISKDPFIELRRRIDKIKKKNIIFCKKFRKYELRKSSMQDLQLTEKSKVLDETEVSMVDNCYKKALEWAEYHLKLRKAKKRQKLKMVHKTKENGLNEHSTISSCEPSSVENINSKSSNSCGSWSFADPIVKGNSDVTNYYPNEIENLIGHNVNALHPQFKNMKKRRKPLKLQSNSSVQESCFSKPDDVKSKPDLYVEKCFSQANTTTKSPIIQTIRNSSDNFSTGTPHFNKEENIMSRDLKEYEKPLMITSENSRLSKNSTSINVLNCDRLNDRVEANSDNSDQDIVCLESVNCTFHKKQNSLSPSDKYNTQVVNKRKISCSNSRVKKVQKIQKQCNLSYIKALEQNTKYKFDEDIVYIKSVNYDDKICNDKFQSLVGSTFNKSSKVSLTKEKTLEIPQKSSQFNTAKTEHFTKNALENLKEPVTLFEPEFYLEAKSTGTITQEFNWTEQLTVPELNVSEEPVDFPVPNLHIRESVKQFSKELESKFESEGIVIRKGKWSSKEEDLLRRNFEDFQSQFGIYDIHLLLGIGRSLPCYKYDCNRIKKFLKAKHFYIRLGKDINERTLCSIYNKARDMFNQFKRAKDCTENDVANILKLQKKFGNNWTLIGQKLGIFLHDCHRIYLNDKKPVNKGTWSKIEIKNLISAIKSVANVSILNPEYLKGISWKKIAELVSTRNARQCCLEWAHNQSKLFANVSYGKCNKSHAANFLNLLKNKYPVIDKCDIPWTELQKSFKDVTHSEHALRSKWWTMKQNVPVEIKKNFPELINFLYKKYQKYMKDI